MTTVPPEIPHEGGSAYLAASRVMRAERPMRCGTCGEVKADVRLLSICTVARSDGMGFVLDTVKLCGDCFA